MKANPESSQSPNAIELESDAKLIALILEARRVRILMRRLHFTILFLWIGFGAFHYHPSFESRWEGIKFGVLDAASALQYIWGLLLLALVTLRNGEQNLWF